MATIRTLSDGTLCSDSSGVLQVCCTDETCCDVSVSFGISSSASEVGPGATGYHLLDSYARCSGAYCSSESETMAGMPNNNDTRGCLCDDNESESEFVRTNSGGAEVRPRRKSGLSNDAGFASYSSTRVWGGGVVQTVTYSLAIVFNSNAGHPTVRVDWASGTSSGSVVRAWSQGRYDNANVIQQSTTGTAPVNGFTIHVYVY